MEILQKLFCKRVAPENTSKVLKAVLEPLVLFSNGFMVFQIYLSKDGVASTKHFNIVFVVKFIITISATCYCGYSYVRNPNFSIGKNIVDYTVWVLTSMRVLILLTMCLLSSFSAKYIVEYVNVLLETDTKLKLVNVRSAQYEYVRRLGYFMYGLNAVKICALFGTMFLRDLKEYGSFEICETCMGISLPIIVMSAFTTSWTILLTLLQVQMAALNESTRNMTKRRVWFIDDINATTSKRKNVKDEVHLLQKFGQIYAIFIEQTERINKAFVMQLFVMGLVAVTKILFVANNLLPQCEFQVVRILVTASFPFILQQTYKMCKRLHGGTDGATVDVHLVLSNVISAIIMIELVVPCMAVRGEAESFVDCLHWNTWNLENRPALEEMLNFITLQTIHQRVEFTVFGLFCLDGTLLYSMLGAITTYLVILLQFDIE